MSKHLYIENKEYLSAVAAGKSAGYSNDHLSRLCRSDALDCQRVGKSWFIEKSSLESFLVQRGKNFKLLSEGREDDIPLTSDTDKDVVSNSKENFSLTLTLDSNTEVCIENYARKPKEEVELPRIKSVQLAHPIPNTSIDEELMYSAMLGEVKQKSKVSIESIMPETAIDANLINSAYQVKNITVAKKILTSIQPVVTVAVALVVAGGSYSVAQTYNSPVHAFINNTAEAIGSSTEFALSNVGKQLRIPDRKALSQMNTATENLIKYRASVLTAFEPVYTGEGVTHATYRYSTIGIKEEVAIKLALDKYSGEEGLYYYTIDFDELEEGSDMWLFYQTAEFRDDWSALLVNLTPVFRGSVYYVEDLQSNSVTIYGDKKGFVSARFMADRYDAAKWPNLRPDQGVGWPGHVIDGR